MADHDPGSDDGSSYYYIGHHESRRPLPITNHALQQAQDAGYDMVTSPITTPHFRDRVHALATQYMAKHTTLNDETVSLEAPPMIEPLEPIDTPLTPSETISQLIAHTSPWIDLASSDAVVASISRQVLSMEIAYASFCGVTTVLIAGPRSQQRARDASASASARADGLARYARVILEAQSLAPYVQLAIQLPMYGEFELVDPEGDLLPLTRSAQTGDAEMAAEGADLYGSWDAWNMIREVCKYNARLFVALTVPRRLPVESLQSRWFAEPLRLLAIPATSFASNKGGHPVLSKSHQQLIARYMKLKQAPWLLLSDVGPIPHLNDPNALCEAADGYASPSVVDDAPAANSPTPAEAAQQATSSSPASKKDRSATAHLIYLRWLQRNQTPRAPIEHFGAGYQDYLQAPLQPLTDNLESVTYEVFEKDPIKYKWYEKAIAGALKDWAALKKPISGPDGAVVIAVAGSGRGPLVTRALRASEATGVKVQVWAVEKNPNAYVLLKRHNETTWNGVVNVVKSDMRAWKGPVIRSSDDPQETSPQHGKVDMLVSELLGSFADNELSPECLDGVQHVLAETGISIPSSYTAHLTPILAPRLHGDIASRVAMDANATDTPYVVMLHAIDYLATLATNEPQIKQAWEFHHPTPASVLATAEARRAGGVSGGGGGSMAGSDGANEHNARQAKLNFYCERRGVVHGLAGYFEAVLYEGHDGQGKVELSTRPDTIDKKSKDMISWFPIFFPLKSPLYLPDHSELEVTMWRQTDDRKVWYEWIVEAFMAAGTPSSSSKDASADTSADISADTSAASATSTLSGQQQQAEAPRRHARVRLGISELGSSRKVGCLM